MILLARNALANTDFRSVVGHQTYTLASTSAHHAYSWTNTNLLLGSYSGTIGIKTGHTNAAGYSLVFAATRGDRTRAPDAVRSCVLGIRPSPPPTLDIGIVESR